MGHKIPLLTALWDISPAEFVETKPKLRFPRPFMETKSDPVKTCTLPNYHSLHLLLRIGEIVEKKINLGFVSRNRVGEKAQNVANKG